METERGEGVPVAEATPMLVESLPMTRRASEIVADARLVQEVVRSVMIGPSKENPVGVHYGTIPGTPKPTLYKAGAEKLASVFRLAIEPRVTDCSTPDEIRFRVEARVTSAASGVYLGSGIGECSTREAKYQWRAAVSSREFAATPADRRRIKFGRAADGAQDVEQVRTEPSDLAGTVLKMAKKRALVDAVLTVTAASDIFAQDLEDLDETLRQSLMGTENQDSPKPHIKPPARKSASGGAASQVVEGIVDDLQERPYKKPDGTAGKRWGVGISGQFYGTFDPAVADTAKRALDFSERVRLTWAQSGEYRNVVSLEIVPAPAAPKPTTKPAQKPAATPAQREPGEDGDEFSDEAGRPKGGNGQ